MQIIREIITSPSKELVVKLPAEFVNKKIEIIILPYYEESKQLDKKERLLRIFEQSKGVLPEGYKFDRDEAHAR